MPKSLRKRAGAKISIVLLCIFLFLFITTSVVFADPGSLGDVNDDGVVDVRDVVLVMRHVLEIDELDEDQVNMADVNGDEVVDVRDITLIMQYALDIIDEFPIDLPEVVSVSAIDRTTIEVELSEEVADEIAEDKDFYEVTVGNESVDVEDVGYDVDDKIAELEVDLEDKSGVLVVNGVEADEEIPLIPDFTEISATEAALEVTMYFNTPVYLDDDLEPGDDIRLEVDGDDVGDQFTVDAPDSRDDAVDEFTLEITDPEYRPGANDPVRVDLDIEGAEKIFNVWDEPMEQPRVYITNATPDDENPGFEEIVAFDESRLVVAYFSKPVNTTGQNSADEVAVEVTGEDAVGTPFEFEGKIDPIEEDDEREALRIELENNETIPEGAEVTARFPIDEGRKIADRAGNLLAGTYTRSTTAIPGPTLEDASASDLSFDADEQTQEFEVTLAGDMASNQYLELDLSRPDGEGIDYDSADFEVDGADGDLDYDIIDNILKFEPDDEISDGTTITITAEDVDTTGVTTSFNEDELIVTFIRSEVRSEAEAEFKLVYGLSDLDVSAEYTHEDPVDVLASGQDDHTMSFEFNLSGDLAEGESVEIDVSNLVDAGVSFDDNEVSLDNNGDREVEMDNNTIVVTAEDDLTSGTTVEAGGVDVEEGSVTDDVEVIFTRTDSSYSSAVDVDIVASFSEVSVSEVGTGDDQPLVLTFTLDGEVDRFRLLSRIYLPNGFDFEYEDAAIEIVSEGTASISDEGRVSYYSPSGGLDDGTEVTIQVEGVDVQDDGEYTTLFRRVDTGFETTDELEVIE